MSTLSSLSTIPALSAALRAPGTPTLRSTLASREGAGGLPTAALKAVQPAMGPAAGVVSQNKAVSGSFSASLAALAPVHAPGNGRSIPASSLAAPTAQVAQVAQIAQASPSAAAPPPVFHGAKSQAAQRAAIHKAATDFESQFLGQMTGFLSQSVEVDPEFGGGHAEEMFRDMLNPEYGKLMEKRGGLGIAAPVEKAMLRAQGLGE